MTNQQPRVSIGIPVYNGESYLREAIDTLLAQTFTDFEIVISDNASTDSTEAMCKAYVERDKRIRYYRNPQNIGCAANFNHVFTLTKGQYFKWASYDDIHAPTYLEKCVEVLDNEPAVILCYPQSNQIDDRGNYRKDYTKNLNYRSSIPHERFYQLLQTFGWYHAAQIYGLFRSDVLRKTPLLANYPQDDRVLLAELSLLGEFAEVPECLFSRRVHAGTAQIEHNTEETLAIWLDPRNQGKILWLRWRRYLDYCLAIQRHDLTWQEQVLCSLQILRRLFLSPGLLERLQGMMNEVWKAIRSIFSYPFAKKGESLKQKTTPTKTP
jgi:glycosyltransferase involved in cell wall biosynthesis